MCFPARAGFVPCVMVFCRCAPLVLSYQPAAETAFLRTGTRAATARSASRKLAALCCALKCASSMCVCCALPYCAVRAVLCAALCCLLHCVSVLSAANAAAFAVG
eukprot:TRINITY_DN14958_c0_g1_i1.p2 TRINITY_DN14958_c0_g1~~TRINITY_DN14958_c0_g1_i1.p2  ORF type:complete len:105 (-),score=12.41 TRINITY_DN14958_c0_g1_i1:25-339(-)